MASSVYIQVKLVFFSKILSIGFFFSFLSMYNIHPLAGVGNKNKCTNSLSYHLAVNTIGKSFWFRLLVITFRWWPQLEMRHHRLPRQTSPPQPIQMSTGLKSSFPRVRPSEFSNPSSKSNFSPWFLMQVMMDSIAHQISVCLATEQVLQWVIDAISMRDHVFLYAKIKVE